MGGEERRDLGAVAVVVLDRDDAGDLVPERPGVVVLLRTLVDGAHGTRVARALRARVEQGPVGHGPSMRTRRGSWRAGHRLSHRTSPSGAPGSG
ncbi:Uncharacterised protein [Mycobacteroides abscessus]|nr:Uncharacterised protein [Mycobacteroides abscessus]